MTDSSVSHFLQAIGKLISAFFLVVGFGGGPSDIEKGQLNSIGKLLADLKKTQGSMFSMLDRFFFQCWDAV